MRSPILLLCVAAFAVPAYAAPKTEASINPDKIVCKKQLEIGTLAKYNKTCLTQREWKRLRDMSAQMGQGLRDRGFGEGCSMRSPDPNAAAC